LEGDFGFSVVIPTFNRPGQLAGCLEALAAQNYPLSDFEIIVVDDGGTCSLEEAMRTVPAGVSVTLLRQRNAGPAAARNLGASRARGARLAFTDDDCRPHPGWLSGLAAAMDRNPGCAAGGTTWNGNAMSACAAASQSILDEVYRHYNADPERARFFATLNFAVPVEEFRSLGGFDGGFRTSEDREFCNRWLRDGRRMVCAAEAIVRHEGHRGFSSFWKQHYHYGRGACRFHRVRCLYGGADNRLESGSFYWSFLAAPFRRAGFRPRTVLITILVAISQVASACGYWVESRQPGPDATGESTVSGASSR
jgi:glycosyltransferase involved in cell wall biosynthesis